MNIKELDVDDDEESGVAVPTTTYFTTKNELVETNIAVPDIEEVGPDEVLERVGEVMSIIDKTVIVKGAPSEVFARASDQALDSDTLLVFEDRKVLGYVRVHHIFSPRAFIRVPDLRNIWTHLPTAVSGQIHRELPSGQRQGSIVASCLPRSSKEQVCVCESNQKVQG